MVTTAWRNKRTGKICEMPKADYWTFKNGKAVAIYEYYDTAKLIAAAS
jgi:ketosteroid isomerase-like protein